jgi:hypothetical protein
MKRVLFPSIDHLPLQRQFPAESNCAWGDYEFTWDRNSDYDYVVVVDDVGAKVNVDCSKENIILFTGEPPFVKIYPDKFLNQFGAVFTCQKQILKHHNAYRSMPPLPWMTGCDLKANSHTSENEGMTYDDFQKFDNQARLDKICLITSNKKLSKGHRQRVDFALKLKQAMPRQVDIYGNGFRNIPDKFDVQSKYKYSVVIENSSYPDYWTEKLADTYLAGSYPIYFGCPNINDYFTNDELSLIDIKDFDAAVATIKKIIDVHKYDHSIEALQNAKRKVLNKYNMFAVIADKLNSIPTNDKKEEYEIYPIRFEMKDKVQQQIIRLLY